MKIQKVFDFVDKIKPSAFSNLQKTVWLNEIEGMVQADVLLLTPSSMIHYVYEKESTQVMFFPDSATVVFTVAPSFHVGGKLTISGLTTYAINNVSDKVIRDISSDGLTYTFDAGTFTTGTTAESGTLAFDGSETELLIGVPYHKIYYTYLLAMIDFANEEYDKYQNTMALFNTFFTNFTRWYMDTYRPGDGECEEKGYYISAYAIAVKHGYAGTEEQWLASLQGDRAVSTQEAQAAAAAAIAAQTAAEIAAAVAEVAAEVSYDDVPTAGSVKPVRSSGIYTALAGKADLVNGSIPASQLPSYIDNVIEVADYAALPTNGETSKIYVTLNDNKVWRWGGTTYVLISASLALGETAATAYPGDLGKVAYDHSHITGNPHGTTKSDLGLGNVNNTADADKPISTVTQTALNAKQTIIANNANRLFYGSGTIGTLSQLSYPTTAGSFLRQGTSDTPYWSTSSTVLSDIGAVPLSGGTITGDLRVNGAISSYGGMELNPSTSSASHGGYIDFHYNQIGTDYTSRIIDTGTYLTLMSNLGGILLSCPNNINISPSGHIDLLSNNYGIRVNYNEGNPVVAPINGTGGITNTIEFGTSQYRYKNIYLVNNPNVSSDERLKKDVAEVDNAIAAAFVDGLKVVSYKYNDDTADRKSRIGVIAQRLVESDPDFAAYFVDDDGTEDHFLSLRPSDLIFPLIQKVQNLSTEVSNLKVEVAKLKESE